MEILDYNAFRDTLIDALAAYDLHTSIDEAIYLNGNSRGCDIFVHRSDEPKEVWAKLGFEWIAANQALYEEIKDAGPEFIEETVATDPGVDVMIHASFHLHFGLLPVSPDAMRWAAEDINRVGEAFFEDGGVIAEVSLTSTEARLECLRFEANTTAPLATREPWWDQLAEVCVSMLDKLQEILERLHYEYGSPRDVLE